MGDLWGCRVVVAPSLNGALIPRRKGEGAWAGSGGLRSAPD